MVEFAYPYHMSDSTFIKQKPEYTPHFFGIFQTFSLQVWITVASVFIAMNLVHHFLLKKKFGFETIALHVFSVLMRQVPLISSSKLADKMVIYSWVWGAMILCLCHDTVFLSFLSFPPVKKIKHLSDLSIAVQKEDYQCIQFPYTGIAEYIRNTEQENLLAIAENVEKNDLRFSELLDYFNHGKKSMNIALFLESSLLDPYLSEYFISEDRFYQRLNAMYFRKDFCFKDMINMFVHRVMASGIYLKVFQ